MLKQELYSANDHTWYVFCRDPDKIASVIDTNEYLIVSGGEAVAMDPGGSEIFPQVVAAFSEAISVDRIRHFLASHQDPDIISSLPLWMGLCPEAKVHMPWLWSGFIAHFGHQYTDRFVKVPDEGGTIRLGRERELQLIPAHYCHSSGNLNLYDPQARILFSGDIGAALLPDDYSSVFVADFGAHVQYMEAFHRRWMPSNRAKNDWVARVRELDVDMLCPQHGAVMRGEQVGEFLDWFGRLEVGSGVA
jgi:flavorubredoxin